MGCSYLKEAYRLTTKTLSGEYGLTSNSEPRVASRRGLPLIIPGHLRLLLEKRDRKIIKVVLTLLSIYRILSAKPKLKLSTITDPFNGVYDRISEITLMTRQAMKKFSFEPFTASVKGPFVVGRKLKFLTTAGPNGRLAWQNYPVDALALKECNLVDTFNALAKALKCEDLSHKLRDELSAWDQMVESSFKVDKTTIADDLGSSFLRDKYLNRENLRVGKLSLKLEAAGKVRVFAMVDGWTQSLLDYLHRDLFRLLSNIDQDGTFNQHKPVKALIERGLMNLYSFDLSAATDRLPIAIQVDVLNTLYGGTVGDLWRDLLVNRSYHLDDKTFPESSGDYHYSVGQPMGALSSWAMLALTHHLIVQVAAYQCGAKASYQWFTDYAVLGDDIVIGHDNVALAYQRIMRDLGLELNLSKSLISDSMSCEFAKRIYIEGGDVSPIGPRSLLQLMFNPRGLKDMLVNNNLLDRMELADIQGHFLDLLRSGMKFSSRKWMKRLFPVYWDLVGVFGLNLSLDLSPSLRDTAINSLNDKVLNLYKSTIEDLAKSKIASGWFEALESDVNIYNKYRRWFSMLNVGVSEAERFHCSFRFPSSESLLEVLSGALMETSSHHDLPETVADKLKLAYSTQSRLTWAFEPDNVTPQSIKSLKLEKAILRELWEKDPSTALAIVKASQAVPWYVIQDGSVELTLLNED